MIMMKVLAQILIYLCSQHLQLEISRQEKRSGYTSNCPQQCYFVAIVVSGTIHMCHLLRDCDNHYGQEWVVYTFLPPANGTKLPESNVFTLLCDSVHKEGKCTPPGQTHPPRRGLKWAVRILLECILVSSVIPICPIEKNRNLVINRTCE